MQRTKRISMCKPPLSHGCSFVTKMCLNKFNLLEQDIQWTVFNPTSFRFYSNSQQINDNARQYKRNNNRKEYSNERQAAAVYSEPGRYQKCTAKLRIFTAAKFGINGVNYVSQRRLHCSASQRQPRTHTAALTF